MGLNEQIKTRTEGCERLFTARRRTKRAIALTLRYWLSGRLSDDRAYVHKAYHTAATMLSENAGSAELYLLCAFICAELGETDTAADYIAQLKKYRSSWRKSAPYFYGLHLFVEARLAQALHKTKAVRKLCQALDKYNETQHIPALDMLLGTLDLREGNLSAAFAFLDYTCTAGIKSPLLYEAALQYYTEVDAAAAQTGSLLPSFLRWALAQQIDISRILTRLQTQAFDLLRQNITLGTRLYAAYPFDWVLRCICEFLMENADYSEAAFFYYRAADARQLILPGLNDSLIQAAYRNNLETVNRYALAQYLDNGNPDVEIKPFVYHLILSNPDYAALAESAYYEMLQFGCYCLANKLTGRTYYSLYRFMLQMADEGVFTDSALIDAAELLLKPVLFMYELTIENPNVQFVWIFEEEKKESNAYEVRGGKATVPAASPRFTVYCFGENMRHMLDANVSRRPFVQNADTALYARFFRAGLAQTELLIAMSSHTIVTGVFSAENTEALALTIEDNSISKPFRMRVSAALGNCYAANGDDARAAAFYNGLDENVLVDRDIEQMLLVCINTQNYVRAVELIVKKAECITDRNLFFTLKEIAALGTYDGQIANVAYELILKNQYDKKLIAIVLEHYKGSQDEWLALSDALADMAAPERSLDEIILENAIFTHAPDNGAQRVFVRMCEMDSGNALAADFAQYMAYEMIANSLRPARDTIGCLERLFAETGEPFLAYALAHTYLAHEVKTAQSTDILAQAIRLAEADGILFPIFKQLKDKTVLTPYIEKNRPFLHRSAPGKTVILYYKTENGEAYREQPMRYTRFGLYLAHVPHFFGETLTYYISEQMSAGSVSSKEAAVQNERPHLLDTSGDPFYALDDALINEHRFRYEQVESMITERLRERPRIKSRII